MARQAELRRKSQAMASEREKLEAGTPKSDASEDARLLAQMQRSLREIAAPLEPALEDTAPKADALSAEDLSSNALALSYHNRVPIQLQHRAAAAIAAADTDISHLIAPKPTQQTAATMRRPSRRAPPPPPGAVASKATAAAANRPVPAREQVAVAAPPMPAPVALPRAQLAAAVGQEMLPDQAQFRVQLGAQTEVTSLSRCQFQSQPPSQSQSHPLSQSNGGSCGGTDRPMSVLAPSSSFKQRMDAIAARRRQQSMPALAQGSDATQCASATAVPAALISERQISPAPAQAQAPIQHPHSMTASTPPPRRYSMAEWRAKKMAIDAAAADASGRRGPHVSPLSNMSARAGWR